MPDEKITEIAEYVIFSLTREAETVQQLYPGTKEGESAFGKGWRFDKENIDLELIKRLVKSELYKFAVPISKAGIDGESVDVTLSYQKVIAYNEKLKEKEKEKWLSEKSKLLARKNVEVNGKPDRLPDAVGIVYRFNYDMDYFNKVYNEFNKDMDKTIEFGETYKKAITQVILSDERVMRHIIRIGILGTQQLVYLFSGYVKNTRVGLLKDIIKTTTF